VTFELVGRDVAEKLHAVAAFDQGEALGQEAFQLDGADFRAVLLLLAALLGVLVDVKVALCAIGGPVEEIDRGPQQALELGLEARVTERCDQGVKDVGDGTRDDAGFRERPRVGLILERTVTMELQLGEDVVGGR